MGVYKRSKSFKILVFVSEPVTYKEMIRQIFFSVALCVGFSFAYPTIGLLRQDPVRLLITYPNAGQLGGSYPVGDTLNPYSGWRNGGWSNPNIASYNSGWLNGNVGSYSGWSGLGTTSGWKPSPGWRNGYGYGK